MFYKHMRKNLPRSEWISRTRRDLDSYIRPGGFINTLALMNSHGNRMPDGPGMAIVGVPGKETFYFYVHLLSKSIIVIAVSTQQNVSLWGESV